MARKKMTSRVAMSDSLSNFAASLNGGKDKAANDAFFLADLPRDQVEAMYRGDWLARKIVDIVPYDSIREWREWAGDRAVVAAIERTERRLNLRKAVQRAMVLGRLYGGGAIIIGTGESDPASLAQPLYPEAIGPGALRFLHVVSRWQLGATTVNLDPLDPYFGEPAGYSVVAPTRGELTLHPSRVIRFLGNPLPDPLSFGVQLWSDSVLQTLYDAVHAVALTATGATSLIHEAKVDIVTVPNLSEHLANAATTAQLSARFAYAAAMKSINNLLLLGDGETWTRQNVDFAGLPEMVRTFLQMAAGAADIPVTRLLGQSPAGLSATGDSDTRNYYDMISARQELDLRPQLERLDAVLLRSAGVDPGDVSFEFRPLWQLNASEKAQVALSKAQTTQIYAGLNLWPTATTAGLVRSQLLEDGTYPGADAVLAAGGAPRPANDFSPDQPRDPDGRWTAGGGGHAETQNKTPAPMPSPSSMAHEPTASTGLGHILASLNPMSSASAQEVSSLATPVGLAGATSTSSGHNEAQSPDGGTIERVSLRRKGQAGAFAALLGALARIVRRLPGLSGGEEPEPPGAGDRPARAGTEPAPELGTQTEKNKRAQLEDPRIRSDLSDEFINDNGTVRWPGNNGAANEEVAAELLPGMLVDKYGTQDGSYLAPVGTPFDARSLPYDRSKTPRQTFRVLKAIDVIKSEVAPWFGEPGGGTQFRISDGDIRSLINTQYLEHMGESYDSQ